MSDRTLIVTAAPERIYREIDIDLALPRDATRDSFLRLRGETLEHLHSAGEGANLRTEKIVVKRGAVAEKHQARLGIPSRESNKNVSFMPANSFER